MKCIVSKAEEVGTKRNYCGLYKYSTYRRVHGGVVTGSSFVGGELSRDPRIKVTTSKGGSGCGALNNYEDDSNFHFSLFP